MSFEPSGIETFLEIFKASQNAIRAFPGCLALSLFRDAAQAHVLYTWSIWESEEALENYRASELFAATWSKTKQLFNAPPLAYSLEKLIEVESII